MPTTTLQAVDTVQDAANTKIVWDRLVRLFHWTTVIGVMIAYATEEWRDIHKAAGYVVLGALCIRVIWGFIGTQHARFSDFVTKPFGIFQYLCSMRQLRERRYLGHNPAGGAMVIALMAALAATGVTGWMMTLDAYWGVDWVEELHELGVNGLLTLVSVHIAGVVWSSYRHRENLVKSMLNGKKVVNKTR